MPGGQICGKAAKARRTLVGSGSESLNSHKMFTKLGSKTTAQIVPAMVTRTPIAAAWTKALRGAITRPV